jgi:hypothetical protein
LRSFSVHSHCETALKARFCEAFYGPTKSRALIQSKTQKKRGFLPETGYADFETPFWPAISAPPAWSRLIGLTGGGPAHRIEKPGTSAGFLFAALPPRSMVGQLPLEQHIGVRIPGGQPIGSKGLRSDLSGPNLGHCGNFCGNSSALYDVQRCLPVPLVDDLRRPVNLGMHYFCRPHPAIEHDYKYVSNVLLHLRKQRLLHPWFDASITPVRLRPLDARSSPKNTFLCGPVQDASKGLLCSAGPPRTAREAEHSSIHRGYLIDPQSSPKKLARKDKRLE